MRYWQRWERASAATIFGVVAVAYFPLAVVTWWTMSRSGLGEAVAGTAGISVVAFLSLPRRRWPIVAAAILVAQFGSSVADRDAFNTSVMLGLGLAAAAQGMCAALVYNRLTGRRSGAAELPDLARRALLGTLAFAACGLGAAVGASVVSLTLWSSDIANLDGAFFGRRLTAQALGVVIVAPMFLVWTSARARRPWTSGGALSFPIALGFCALVALQLGNLPVMSVVFAGLIGAGAFFDVRTVALTNAALAAAIVISVTAGSNELIAGMTPSTSLTLSKIEFLMFALAAYLTASEVNEHRITADTAAEHMTTVGQLQQLLLPPISMGGSGYAVRGTYDPAQRRVGIGGDWYLARVAMNGHLVFAVGDIVGHDFSAARSMAVVRSSLVLEAALRPDASDLLEKLDAYSTAEPSIRFSTAWVGVYDPVNRTLDYACAGHPPPLLVANDRVVRLDRANTALVGIPQQGRRSTTTFIPPGAAIVLYTDGLVERRSAGVEPGIERLEAAILRDGAHPDSLLATMLHDSDREDDAAVAVIDFDQIEPDPDHTDPRLEMPRASARAR